MKKVSLHGQSLSEYLLVAAIIGVGSIAGLTLLTSTFDQGAPKLVSAIFNNGGSGSRPAPGPNIPLWVSDPDNWQPVVVTMPDGTEMTLPYPQDVPNAIETAGANGATERYLAALDAFLEQARVPEDISEEEHNALEALSNQGHRMAALQKIIETNISENATTRVDFRRVEVDFEGETLSMRDIVRSMSGGLRVTLAYDPNNPTTSPFNTTRSTVGTGDEMMKFINLYNQAETAGTLNNPTVHALINSLATDIVLVGDSFSSESVLPLYQEGRRDTYFEETASTFTRFNSRGICVTGNGRDAGISCG